MMRSLIAANSGPITLVTIGIIVVGVIADLHLRWVVPLIPPAIVTGATWLIPEALTNRIHEIQADSYLRGIRHSKD